MFSCENTFLMRSISCNFTQANLLLTQLKERKKYVEKATSSFTEYNLT